MSAHQTQRLLPIPRAMDELAKQFAKLDTDRQVVGGRPDGMFHFRELVLELSLLAQRARIDMDEPELTQISYSSVVPFPGGRR